MHFNIGKLYSFFGSIMCYFLVYIKTFTFYSKLVQNYNDFFGIRDSYSVNSILKMQ